MSSVFLSYSSTDVKLATRVQDLLEARGYATFRDKDRDEGIPGGTKWAEELFLNLERFRIVVFLATPDSLESRWCHTELAVAIARRKHVVQISTRKVKVHPVLAATQSIGPTRDVGALVDKLVSDLERVGLGPRDSSTWDPNESPYPGLERLTEKHAAVLFGREDEIEQVVDRLDRPKPPPILVVGPSGSGKSSLIRAGVVPRLKQRPGTTVLVVDTGSDPLRSVALEIERADRKSDAQRLVDDPDAFALAIERLATAADDGRVVLILDQAEDLVSRAARPGAIELVRRLVAIDRDRLAVIVILRSASLDPWMRDAEIGSLTPGDPVQVRPLDRAALREVIVGPARLAGIRIEPDELVEQILEDTDQGEALPLLAALLQELTKEHTRTHPAVITPKEYAIVGPVSRVIERRAQAAVEDIRTQLGLPEAAVVDAYLRLVEIDESRQPVRTELVADELPDDVKAIFGVLEGYRLVTRDRQVVPAPASGPNPSSTGSAPAAREVLMAVHEAVFRAWPALKSAIDARIDDLRIRTWLRQDADTWSTSGRGQVALTGGRLDQAVAWSRQYPGEMTDEVREYLDAAVGQRRVGRIARIAVAGLAGVVALVGLFAFQAVQARNEAESSRLATDARANFGTRLDLGLLLALEASARSGDPLVQAMPLVGLTQGPGPRKFEQPGGTTDSGALDEDGSRAVLVQPDGVMLWDVSNASRVATIPGPATVTGISADGSTVAVARQLAAESSVIEIARWPEATAFLTCDVTGEIQRLRVSPANDFVVAVTAVMIDDVERSQVKILSTSDCTGSSRDDLQDSVVDIDIADGLVAVGMAGGAAIWDPSIGTLATFAADGPSLRSIALAGGDRLGATSTTGDLLIWDTSVEDALPRQFPVFGETVVGVRLRFSPEQNAWIAGSQKGDLRAVGSDGKFTLRASATSLPAADPASDNDETASALDIAVTETGAVTIDESGRIIRWDLVGIPPLGDQVFADGRIDRLRAMPDGSLIAGGPDGVWQLDGVTGEVRDQRATESVTAIAPGVDGWAIGLQSGEVLRSTGSVDALAPIAVVSGPVNATAMLDTGAVAIADGEGAMTIVAPPGAMSALSIDGSVLSLASHGRWLFAGSRDGSVHVIDASGSPRAVARSQAHEQEVSSLEVSPDGSTLASGSDDRSIIVWTIGSDGRLTDRHHLLGHTDRINTLSISPDGHWLASSGEDMHVILWNLDTGQRVGDPIPVVREPVLAFGQSGDRQLFVSDDRDGLVRWDMRPEAWARIACDLIGGRTFTLLERDQFLGGATPPDRCGAS